MSKKSTGISEQWLIDKGYTLGPNGAWTPPALKSKFIQSLKPKQEELNNYDESLIEKKVVIRTEDFTHAPKTEWFVRYNVPSKKNSRQNFVKNGVMRSIPSAKHAEYVKLTEMQYDVFGREFRAAVEYYKIKPPYRIEFTFIRSSHHSFDYCNAAQTCEDMMKDQYKKKVLIRKGWFEDDSAEFLIPVFKEYQYNKENPGVVIKILIK